MGKSALASESLGLLAEISNHAMWHSQELLGYLGTERYASRRISSKTLASVRNGIRSLVTRLLADDTSVRSVASRSYAHENNFAKLVLVPASKGPHEVRLHVWSKAAGCEHRAGWEANIHEHSADFVSLIVVGGLAERTYEIAVQDERRSASRYRAFHCGSRAENSSYQMLPAGYERLRMSREYEKSAGDWSGLRHDVLHRAMSQNLLN